LKFNHAIGPKEEIHYKNIDDAKGAPLDSTTCFISLLLNPFAYLENKIEVERFDILEWE